MNLTRKELSCYEMRIQNKKTILSDLARLHRMAKEIT